MEILLWLMPVLCLVVGIAILVRRHMPGSLKRAEALPPYPLRRKNTVDQDIALLRTLPPSPLTRLSFGEALSSSDRFGTELERYCTESLSQVLTGDGINIAVQSLLLSSDELTLVYKFSGTATQLYKSGQATIPLHTESGRLLPLMVDESGRILEQAKGVNMLAMRLAQSWSIIVSAAHIVSGLDVVKRLKDIDGRLSFLLAGRRIDQDARLNRIYTEARSLLSEEIDRDSIRELKRCRYDLYQLRQVWRGEILDLLIRAGLPDRSQWHHSSWWRRGSREKQVVISLAPIAEKLERLRLALMMDACIAFSSGTMQDLVENALPSEENLWTPVGEESALLAGRFRKSATQGNVAGITAGISGYASVLHGIQGQATSSVSLLQ